MEKKYSKKFLLNSGIWDLECSFVRYWSCVAIDNGQRQSHYTKVPLGDLVLNKSGLVAF